MNLVLVVDRSAVTYICRIMQDKTMSKARILDVRNIQRESDSQYVVSYGGGVNSTALIVLLIKKDLPLDHVVFSDTGNEMPETYEYLSVMKRYLGGNSIPLKIVRVRSGESLSDRCLRRKVIPSQMWRWCTRDMKVTPIHAFYRSLKSHVYQYMGIDYGEVHRMKSAKADYVTNLYPLIDYRISRDGCINLIKEAELPVPVKSGCYMCPFNNMGRWAEIYEKHPDLYRHAIEIEESGKHFGSQSLAPKGHTLRELEGVMRKKQKLPMVQTDGPCGGECMV